MEPEWVIGLMSGTSLDGIDVAMIKTDGHDILEYGPFRSFPYDASFQKMARGVLGKEHAPDGFEEEVTNQHIRAVERFLQSEGVPREKISLVGFHGQTIFHQPKRGVTVQVGNGAEMARALGVDVVHDFRSLDVANGGEGAPLVPVFHRALLGAYDYPVAVLNLGGVGNVTWIGPEGGDHLVAFDTGPGNALIDDWMLEKTGVAFDADGKTAMQGRIHDDCVNSFMAHPYFQKAAPKSLDRDEFQTFARELVRDLSVEDGAATLTAFTVASVMAAQDHFPNPAYKWIVCGGGRLNKSIMSALRAFIPALIVTAEDMEWDGDAIEAQAFAFLAKRAKHGLPFTYSGTTGVKVPLSGGVLSLK